MNLTLLTVHSTIVLLASASLTLAQNINQGAVDTLTKDVATVVFANINQPKAHDIYQQLLSCGEGCDAQTIIRTVGGWDAVGMKMQELSELKNTAPFIAMSPEEANAAIRKQLAQFYAKYKADKNYGKPLNPAIQAKILAKIDAILPPAAAPEPSSTAVESSAPLKTVTDDESGIRPEALQISQLERRAREAEQKQLWMMIAGAVIGLLVGAGAVYLLFYRAALNNAKALLNENNRLQNALETAKRAKPGPIENVNSVRVDYRQKAGAYDAIVAELGTDNPLQTIRQLKQQTTKITTQPAPIVRSGESLVEPSPPPKSALVQVQAPPVQVQTPVAPPAPARSEVFYFPPPDTTGSFDSQQKSTTLSPESAYRFSINAEQGDRANPSVASFRFEAEPGRLARFLTYRNYMIEPACESENSYTTTHTRITMRRDGVAVLENGIWRVKTKALIRYE